MFFCVYVKRNFDLSPEESANKSMSNDVLMVELKGNEELKNSGGEIPEEFFFSFPVNVG